MQIATDKTLVFNYLYITTFTEICVLNYFCKEILGLDENIRFAGITSGNGELVVAEYRTRTKPLLSLPEAELSALQSATRMETRKPLEGKIGKVVYSFTLYEKVKRATIELKDNSLLLVSFDLEAEHDAIIMNKIIPFVKQLGLKERL